MGLRVAFPGDRTIDNEGESFVLRTYYMVIWGEQTGGATPYNLFLASVIPLTWNSHRQNINPILPKLSILQFREQSRLCY